MHWRDIRWAFPLMTGTTMALVLGLGMAWWGMNQMANRELVAKLEREGVLIEQWLGSVREWPSTHPSTGGQVLPDSLQGVARRLGDEWVVFTPDGTLRMASYPSPNAMVAMNRTEVSAALSGRVGVAQRFHPRFNTEVVTVVLPLFEKGIVVALLQLTAPLGQAGEVALNSWWPLAWVCLASWVCLMGGILWRTVRLRDELTRFSRSIQQWDPETNPPFQPPRLTMLWDVYRACQVQFDRVFQSQQTRQQAHMERQAMVNHLSDGLVVLDAQETILSANPSAMRFLRLSPSSLGVSLSSQVRHSQLMAVVRKGLSRASYEADQVVFRDREDAYFQVECIPILDDHQLPTDRTILLLRHVTDAIESELAQHRLIVNVSHRMKGPLNRLTDATAMIPATASSGYGMAIKAIRTMLSDLVYLTRLKHTITLQQLSLQTESLPELVGEVVDILKESADDKGVTVQLVADSVSAYINRSSLSQAVLQLLKNAISYSPKDGLVTVKVWGDPLPTILIQDEGIGIPSESLPHLFEPFFRINSPVHDSVEGGGLGLTIVKSIVDAHEGVIEVVSEFGKGTVVTVRLPKEKGGLHVLSHEQRN